MRRLLLHQLYCWNVLVPHYKRDLGFTSAHVLLHTIRSTLLAVCLSRLAISLVYPQTERCNPSHFLDSCIGLPLRSDRNHAFLLPRIRPRGVDTRRTRRTVERRPCRQCIQWSPVFSSGHGYSWAATARLRTYQHDHARANHGHSGAGYCRRRLAELVLRPLHGYGQPGWPGCFEGSQSSWEYGDCSTDGHAQHPGCFSSVDRASDRHGRSEPACSATSSEHSHRPS